MIDADLADIYGYTTKNFNRQVKNNIERFDDDFRFQLTDTEVENLRCKNCTSSWGGVRYNPYAFTELGIYTLMTVLKGELAVNQSKKLLRLFKKLKDFFQSWKNRKKYTRYEEIKEEMPRSDEEYNYQKAQKERDVDAILDKVAKNGYDSLTKEEKEFLFKNSK